MTDTALEEVHRLQDSHPFRIGVDGFNMALSRGTGVATYGRILTQCLARMGHPVDVIYGMNISRHTSPPLREVIFFDSLEQEHVRKEPFPLSRRWWTDQQTRWSGYEAVEVEITGRVEGRGFAHRMPTYDRILNVPSLFRAAHSHYRRTRRFMSIRVQRVPAVMHWTYPLPIRLIGAKNVYTVHDLVPLRLPFTTLDDKGFHYRLIADLMRQADGICTVSEASRRDILSFHPDAAAKVINTYQSFQPSALAAMRSEEAATAEIGGLFGLQREGYFLFFGSLEPKKNIGRMIEAFLVTATERRLVLVGAMAWKSENELRFLRRGVEAGRILHLDYLPEPVLMALIRSARAVLFPSLTEGFGLPVLEALSYGTPVLTSREGALPEVAGEAAVYVDAYDTVNIAAGINRLDKEDATCAALRMAGPTQAARFSVSVYQQRLQAMYEWLLSPKGTT
jgi:glycosyltransferase involved in cell wall biosynthesis